MWLIADSTSVTSSIAQANSPYSCFRDLALGGPNVNRVDNFGPENSCTYKIRKRIIYLKRIFFLMAIHKRIPMKIYCSIHYVEYFIINVYSTKYTFLIPIYLFIQIMYQNILIYKYINIQVLYLQPQNLKIFQTLYKNSLRWNSIRM